MKVCPVCSESFADDLKFCDLDGTKLTRDPDANDQQSQNKLWSMLGIGLLVGALGLSAVTVFLLPKARVSPPVASSTPQDTASSGKPASETPGSAAGPTVASATNEQPEIVVTEGALPDAKKKEKIKALANEDTASSLNPKAAAQGTENTEKVAPPVEASPPPKKPEPAPAVKPVAETREAETAPKPAASPDPKKDPKHQTTDSSKDSNKKKGEEKDKKKSGFFRVFKKIFGKD